jgi:hypothetical protein
MAKKGLPDVGSTVEDLESQWHRVVKRRSFLRGLGVVSAALPAVALVPGTVQASDDSRLNKGDIAILRFLAAAEIIESDLWEQYSELGGALGANPAYKAALENIDGDMPQYITDNTDDEESHAEFLNAYLKSKGAPQVSLEKFRTLPTTAATGAQNRKRLTNLKNLTVDTSWYTRYRGMGNPDLGATFDQAVTIRNQPAIPLNDTETPPTTAQDNLPTTVAARRMQAIADTAAFHFALIEQGGSSLYTGLATKASSLEVLRIIVSIGGVEVDHFSLWHDKVANTVSGSLAGLTDPVSGLHFPDLSDPAHFDQERFQPNKILPEPADFISKSLPKCSVIRPTSAANAGAVAAVRSLTADHLFEGQSQEFLRTLMALAVAADAARRDLQNNND